jgi:multidrug efflux system membrane fusion protein
MSPEKPNMLDQQDVQEPMPSFPPTEPPLPRKHKRHGWLWVVILVAVGLGVYFLYFRQHSNPASAATTDAVAAAGGRSGRGQAVPVIAARAYKGNIGRYFNGLGAVTPLHTVTVQSQISGYLMKVLYTEGQMVHQGDPLVEIDPRPYQVMLESAQAGLLRDQANLDNAKVDLTRYQTLVPQRAVPEQQLATQGALVKSDEGIVATDQAQIDTAKLDLVYCHITAPITGRVGLRLVDPGNYVTPMLSTGLVVITQIEPITVIFTLAEDLLPPVMQKLRAGARLKVEAWNRDLTTQIAEGVLETVDNQVDPTTGTVKLRAKFDNKDGALFPNQFVNARLLVEEERGVALIPTAAVQRNSQRTYIYLVKDLHRPKSGGQGPSGQAAAGSAAEASQLLSGTATVQTITIGISEGDETQVTSGLNPGDVVVVTGVDRLQEGTKVRVEMSPAKAGT